MITKMKPPFPSTGDTLLDDKIDHKVLCYEPGFNPRKLAKDTLTNIAGAQK